MSVSTPIYNLVKETTTSTSTGTINLAGAVTGYAAFSVVGTTNRTTICIRAVNGSGVPTGQWEICRSVYTSGSPNTLSRGTLLASSTGSRINFSAGTKEVFIVADATTLQPRTWDLVVDFDADPSFTNDCCAALQSALTTMAANGGGVLYVPPGRYKMSGALQNTSTDNAQVIIPTVAMTVSQVSIAVVGAQPAPSNFDLIGGGTPYPVPSTGYSIFESTLTGASGTASFIGAADHGSDFQANNLQIRFKNMVFVSPADPTFTMLDLRFQYATPDIVKDVLIHASGVDLKSTVIEPTHNNAYGLKLPGNNQGAQGTFDGFTVFGHWVAVLMGECTYGQNMAAWGCIGAVETVFTYHPWCIWQLATAWCPYGIVAGSSAPGPGSSNVTYGVVGIMNVERANSGAGEGDPWMDTIADVYDPGNVLHVHVNNWISITAAVGNNHTFTITGGSHVVASELS